MRGDEEGGDARTVQHKQQLFKQCTKPRAEPCIVLTCNRAGMSINSIPYRAGRKFRAPKRSGTVKVLSSLLSVGTSVSKAQPRRMGSKWASSATPS